MTLICPQRGLAHVYLYTARVRPLGGPYSAVYSGVWILLVGVLHVWELSMSVIIK